jgi:rubredoxin
MIFGAGPTKDDGSPGDYACKDCGYVFTKGPKAWAALPSDWSCPECGSAKWRFDKVPKGGAGGAAKVGGAAKPAKKRGLFG